MHQQCDDLVCAVRLAQGREQRCAQYAESEPGLRFSLCFRLEQEAIYKAVVHGHKQADSVFLLSGSKMRRPGGTSAELGLSCAKGLHPLPTAQIQ